METHGKGLRRWFYVTWGPEIRLPEANVSGGVAVLGQGNSSMGDILNLLTPGSDCVSGIRSHTLIRGAGRGGGVLGRPGAVPPPFPMRPCFSRARGNQGGVLAD